MRAKMRQKVQFRDYYTEVSKKHGKNCRVRYKKYKKVVCLLLTSSTELSFRVLLPLASERKISPFLLVGRKGKAGLSGSV